MSNHSKVNNYPNTSTWNSIPFVQPPALFVFCRRCASVMGISMSVCMCAMYTYSYTCIQVHAYNIVAIHEFARKCDDIVDRYPGAQQSICGQNKFLAAFPGTAWSHLRLFWGHLGAILGPSWRPVGPIWGHLAPTSAIMDHRGSSCGLLRPSWGHLGAILRPS